MNGSYFYFFRVACIINDVLLENGLDSKSKLSNIYH